MHGIRMLNPGLEMVLVDGEFLGKGLDMRRIFVEEELQFTNPISISQTPPKPTSILSKLGRRGKLTVPIPFLIPSNFDNVCPLQTSSFTFPVLTSPPSNVSIIKSHNRSCSACNSTTSRVDCVLKELGTWWMAALTSSSILLSRSEMGLVLPRA